MAGAAPSELSRGGMQTKIEAARIATNAGTHMVIGSGAASIRCVPIAEGARCTWFLTAANPVTARKKWIAGALEPKGTLTIDAGAVAALRRGKSLLPAGVIGIDGCVCPRRCGRSSVVPMEPKSPAGFAPTTPRMRRKSAAVRRRILLRCSASAAERKWFIATILVVSPQ